MNKGKIIEEMARDIEEATHRASAILVKETSAFVKENHRYHSENDFDKAHSKTLAELEAEYLTEQGYTKQEWISVEDRLPVIQGKYLVYTYDRRMFVCDLIDHYCNGNLQFDDYRVTYWMPLPQPPKMKGAE
jgi:hypothetical protein